VLSAAVTTRIASRRDESVLNKSIMFKFAFVVHLPQTIRGESAVAEDAKNDATKPFKHIQKWQQEFQAMIGKINGIVAFLM
jgi:hypothetical protein